MIKTIIFDFGGVIMTIDQNAALARLKEMGMENAEKTLDPYTQTGIFGELEEGKINADEFQSAFGLLLGRKLTFDDCQHFWLAYRKDVPRRNLAILKHLRSEGYRLVLLSNTNPFMMKWALSGNFDGEGHSLQDYFDSLYLSYKLGVMKPNPEFFKKVIAAEKINPEEALFVDDGKRNVEAAEKLGLHTFCPVNGADWTKEILEYI